MSATGCLKSASDFYGKLGALLGKESDLASRRALWQANYEVAELTGKVGKPEDALAAHRQVLAAREALAAEAQADPEIKADVGAQPDGRRRSCWRTPDGPRRRRRRTARPRPCWSNWPRRSRRPPRRGLSWLTAGRVWAGYSTTIGRDDEALSLYRLARADQEALAAAPGATADVAAGPGDHDQHGSPFCWRMGRASRRQRRPSPARRWRSNRSWSTTTPPSPSTAAAWRTATTSSACVLWQTGKPSEAEAEYRKALAIQQKLADDNPAVDRFRSGLARTHHNLGSVLSDTGKSTEAEAEYRKALAIQRKLVDDNPAVTRFRSDLAGNHNNLGILLSNTGKSSASGGRVPQGAGDPAEAGRRQPRRHRFPQPPGGEPRQPRHAAVRDGQVVGSGGRVPQGAGDPAEAGRRQPRRHPIPQRPGEQPHQPRQPAVETGKPSEAEAEYRRALAIQQKLADDNPAVTQFPATLAAQLPTTSAACC